MLGRTGQKSNNKFTGCGAGCLPVSNRSVMTFARVKFRDNELFYAPPHRGIHYRNNLSSNR
ncbi:hypothetical protein FEI17_10415 [Kosakonia radicincitans]|nr:hypothetical protein FEI17_10415 [Kosakonia radicincitans]